MIESLVLIRNLLVQGIGIYRIVIFIYILMSWVPSMRENAFGQFIGKIAEPYLAFFRKFIPPLGMIDISPIVALIALSFISSGVFNVFNIIIQMLLK